MEICKDEPFVTLHLFVIISLAANYNWKTFIWYSSMQVSI